MAADPTLAMLMGSGLLVAAAFGAYLGINRARAPLGAPEQPQVIERRQRFKAENLGKAKAVLVVAGLLFFAASARSSAHTCSDRAPPAGIWATS